jgi:hypothetical protein
LGRLDHGAYCRPDLFTKASQKGAYHTVRDCGVYTDTLTHDPWVLDMLIHTLGVQRIAMGSDYPYPLGEMDPFAESDGKPKKVYPGHMIEYLPSNDSQRAAAWEHFHWLPRENADGVRSLPRLTDAQKNQLLHLTAKEWLGFSPAKPRAA